jgi:integrase
VPLPAEPHIEQRFLTASEVELLAEAMEPRFRAMVLLAAYGGLRFGELAGLRRARVDLLRSRVVVTETLMEANGQLMFGPPKTKRSRRTVPLPRRIAGELEHHLHHYVLAAPDALVFTGPKGALLRRAGFHRVWWKPR